MEQHSRELVAFSENMPLASVQFFTRQNVSPIWRLFSQQPEIAQSFYATRALALSQPFPAVAFQAHFLRPSNPFRALSYAKVRIPFILNGENLYF